MDVDILTVRNAGVDNMETDKQSIRSLVRDALDSTLSTIARCGAVASLADRGEPTALAGLLRVMRECSPKEEAVLFEVARWLGSRRRRCVESMLIRLMKARTTGELTCASAYALGLLGSRRAAPHLRELVGDSDLSVRVRAYAAEALAHLPSRKTSDVLISCLDHPSSELRYWAIFSLGELGEATALSSLRRLAKSDHRVVHQEQTVASEAKWAIRRILRIGDRGTS